MAPPRKPPSGNLTVDRKREIARGWHSENRERSRANDRRWHEKNPAKTLFNAAKGSAKCRGLEFSLTVEHIEDLLEAWTCALTGVKLRWDLDEKKDDFAPSLDRIENGLGYVPDNVRIVAWRVNAMRGNMTDKQLRFWVERIMEPDVVEEAGADADFLA